MQVEPQEASGAKASTTDYDTFVISGMVGQEFPKQIAGGEVVSWSSGHQLAAADALLEFVEYVAEGGGISGELSTKAQAVLALMRARMSDGWDAQEVPHA